MEPMRRVKKSLKTPIRKLTSYVSAVKKQKPYTKSRNKRVRGWGGRRACKRSGKTPKVRTAHPRDPSVIRSYQADLEKERQQREAMNAQKNAQRAAVRAHFRRKYQLSENWTDTNHLRSVGGKVFLPHELSKMIHPETKPKDDGFNLLHAFQGLTFSTTTLSGRKHSRTATPIPASGNSCKVM